MSISTLRHVAIAGAGALLLSVQTASSFGPTEVYRATEAIDYVLGSTRALGYFQTVAGQCLLTLTIAEVVDLDRGALESAARLRFAMQTRARGSGGQRKRPGDVAHLRRQSRDPASHAR
jgi:hypothetical protein